MRAFKGIKRIGVISDTHIPSRAATLPSSVHNAFKSVDLIIHCGDIVSNETLIELSAIAPLCAVRGNMDPQNISLPLSEILDINSSHVICVSHGAGSPYDIKHRLYKEFISFNPSIILYGHTHVAADEIYNKIRFLNPGSATAGSKYDSVAILDVAGSNILAEVITL
jgi:putative phosphoesterase